MKALVVYYSRSGKTRTVATAISKSLQCDLEELIDTKKRSGIIGWLRAGKDAKNKVLTTIQPIKKAPEVYDLVIIGTPIWFYTMTPAIRTYFKQNKEKLKNIAIFSTFGGNNRDLYPDVEATSGMKPKTTLEIRTKEVKKDMYLEKVNEFVNNVKR